MPEKAPYSYPNKTHGSATTSLSEGSQDDPGLGGQTPQKKASVPSTKAGDGSEVRVNNKFAKRVAP